MWLYCSKRILLIDRYHCTVGETVRYNGFARLIFFPVVFGCNGFARLLFVCFVWIRQCPVRYFHASEWFSLLLIVYRQLAAEARMYSEMELRKMGKRPTMYPYMCGQLCCCSCCGCKEVRQACTPVLVNTIQDTAFSRICHVSVLDTLFVLSEPALTAYNEITCIFCVGCTQHQ